MLPAVVESNSGREEVDLEIAVAVVDKVVLRPLESRHAGCSQVRHQGDPARDCEPPRVVEVPAAQDHDVTGSEDGLGRMLR